ncbi:SCP2 sterol-binding domain-containing protein [Goodfellowiella coeruleoviolacea]|uniref:SCP-2 sterol transfer family protein n=1 Tax=Goodfellowiella coeruleoviolacea TaxID=334858 RepID=A0AAE3GF78_9PSEU|nr:SCP2 sterol-binding domain-containing protein [Goodfellowiella coeruleoviolacea]MCP2166254.1 SCP-2 sterol transfer family protein [Goodfellowiella coeruleoviolacea]
MTNIDLSPDAVARLSPDELITTLRRLDPASDAARQLDIDVVARAIDPKKLSREQFVDLLAVLGDLADAGAAVNLSQLDPQNFARLIARAGKDQIEAVTSQPVLRERILDEVFRRMEVHFRADRAGSTKAVVHWRISGAATDDGYDRYETVIENETCAVSKNGSREPRATVTLTPVDFLKLVTGNASAPVLFMTGKLKVAGDLAFAAGLTNLFTIPKA